MNFYIFSSLKKKQVLVLYAHEILKEGSPKVAIDSPSSDTDILLLTLGHLYECKQIIFIIDSHE